MLQCVVAACCWATLTRRRCATAATATCAARRLCVSTARWLCRKLWVRCCAPIAGWGPTCCATYCAVRGAMTYMCVATTAYALSAPVPTWVPPNGTITYPRWYSWGCSMWRMTTATGCAPRHMACGCSGARNVWCLPNTPNVKRLGKRTMQSGGAVMARRLRRL